MGWWPDEYDYLFDGLSEQEAKELAQDLFEPAPRHGRGLWKPPEEDYFIPTLHEDARPEAYTPGYPDNDRAKTRVVPIPREYFTEEQAKERFNRMLTENGWRLLGEPFYTARYWCWKIEEQ